MKNKTAILNRTRITKIQKKNWDTYLKLNRLSGSKILREFIDSCISTLPERFKKNENVLDSKNKEIDDILKTMEMKIEN